MYVKGGRSKIAQAEDADWSFMVDSGAVEACSIAAKMAAKRFDAHDFQDYYHHALLWLAVRPNIQQDWIDARWDRAYTFALYIYDKGLLKWAQPEAQERYKHVPWPEDVEFYDEDV